MESVRLFYEPEITRLNFLKINSKMKSKKTQKKSLGLNIILILVSLVLIFGSIFYAKQRVIFTDTSVYFFAVSDSGSFYNSSRFVGVFSANITGLWSCVGPFVKSASILVLCQFYPHTSWLYVDL